MLVDQLLAEAQEAFELPVKSRQTPALHWLKHTVGATVGELVGALVGALVIGALVVGALVGALVVGADEVTLQVAPTYGGVHVQVFMAVQLP